MTDIVKAVQAGLQDSPFIQALLVEPYIGIDDAWVNGWIFERDLRVRIENSQRCAIVVNTRGGWTTPNVHNTTRFPLIVIDVWADPTRNDDHSVARDDAEAKALVIFDAIRQVMHTVNRDVPGGGSIQWGDLKIVSSESLEEPTTTDVSGGNGAVQLRARFGVTY